MRILGVVRFVRVCTEGRWFHSGSLVRLGSALGSFGYHLIRSGMPWVVRFIRDRSVSSGTSCGSLRSLGLALEDVGFIPVRTECG